MREDQATASGSMMIGDMNGPVMYWGPERRPLASAQRTSCMCGAVIRPARARGGRDERAAA